MTPSFMNSLRQDWLGNIRGDLLAGLVVALALIPEAIAFSIIAGVDPKVGLYASFSIAVLTAITGGRPGMISAATAATAVLMISLVRDHENGLQLLFAATILAGLLQIAMGLLKLGNVMRFVSRSVLTGFVNALAILIFLAQLPEILPAAVPDFLNSILKSANIGHEVEAVTMTWLMIAGGLAIIYLFPRITTLIPSPLVCILVLTTLALVFRWDVQTVADLGELPDGLPFSYATSGAVDL